MKQNNKATNKPRKPARVATAAHDGTPHTADRKRLGDTHATRRDLIRLKKLVDTWLDARARGTAHYLLSEDSAWRRLLAAVGLSVIDTSQTVSSAARGAQRVITARYDAARADAQSDRTSLPIVVDVITQDGCQPVPIADAMSPLVDTVDPAQAWQVYDTRVRSVPSAACDLSDVLPYVSARDVLTVDQIADRLPADRRNAAAAVQRKVRSVLRACSPAYAAYTAADLTAVKRRGAALTHVVRVQYADGAQGKAQ